MMKHKSINAIKTTNDKLIENCITRPFKIWLELIKETKLDKIKTKNKFKLINELEELKVKNIKLDEIDNNIKVKKTKIHFNINSQFKDNNIFKNINNINYKIN